MDYAKAKSIEYNQEHLALACLFHDLGLTEEFHNPKQAFIYNSSATLRDFLQAKQYAAQDTVTLMETIDFHFSLRPHWQSGPVAGLLQIGTWMVLPGENPDKSPAPGKRQEPPSTVVVFSFTSTDACVVNYCHGNGSKEFWRPLIIVRKIITRQPDPL